MMRVRGIIIALLAVLLTQAVATVCQAQIKIIPKTVLDSVANPKRVKDSGMSFQGGDVVSFGELSEDLPSWQRTIEWRNAGNSPVAISSVRSSCSCLKAEVLSKVVGVGEKVDIKVTYYPKGHPGEVEQRVYIYTNLSESVPTAVLRIKGRVIPSADSSADYPFYRGELRLRQDSVVIRGKQKQVVRIACLNSGKRALRLSADTLLSSRGLRMHSEPEVLQGGKEGDLVILFTPDVGPQSNMQSRGKTLDRAQGQIHDKKQTEELHLYIKGIALPLRERLIRIKVEDK